MPELGTYTVTVLLKAQEEVSRAVKDATRALNDMENYSGKLSNTLSNLGKIAVGVVGGLLGFNLLTEVKKWVEDSVNAFIRFEAASVKLASLSADVGQSVQGLAQAYRVVASAMARELAVSGQEAIEALESLVKAGLSGRDASLALRDAIMMAKLENIDFTTASNNLVQVMAQFNITGSEAKHVVDTLVNASRLGIGSANDFAQGLANVGATARALGLSLEDTTTWLVILERRLGSAQEAGTHLNRFLLELYEIAGKLGVPIRDLEGNLRNANDVILDVIAVVRESGMSFDQLQEKLRGTDMRALKTLLTISQMNENFEQLRQEVARSGSALEAYKNYLETTEGKMAMLRAENDRLMRSMGEGASSILTMIAPAFLQLGNAITTAWRGIIGTFTGVKLEKYLAYVETQVRILGRVSEETAAKWIKAWVDIGELTLSEALKIAESVGIYDETIQELIDRAIQAGITVPESFQSMASAASISSQQTVSSIKTIEEQVKSLQNELKNLGLTFDVLGKAVGLGENFYDVTLSIMKALGYDVQLSEEAKASKERLAATQEVLNYITQAGSLVQQALQFSMLGATDASNMLLNGLTSLTTALSDGIITNEEFISILNQMGVDAQNVAGSLHNILVKALNATREAIEGNISTAMNFVDVLKKLDGMTVHTYHIHHIVTVHEGEGKTGESMQRIELEYWQPEAIPLQRGSWYTPEGLYYLHRGEMVLPRHVAEWFRSHGSVTSQKTINVNVNVNTMSMSSPHELAEIVSREIVRNLRRMGA